MVDPSPTVVERTFMKNFYVPHFTLSISELDSTLALTDLPRGEASLQKQFVLCVVILLDKALVRVFEDSKETFSKKSLWRGSGQRPKSPSPSRQSFVLTGGSIKSSFLPSSSSSGSILQLISGEESEILILSALQARKLSKR